MSCLGLFDYFMEDTFYNKIPDRKFSHKVVFSGCIEKNSENFYMIQILTMISNLIFMVQD